MDDEEHKIIIDENWKTQVQREKEQLQEGAGQGETEHEQKQSAEEQPPEASFSSLVTSLVAQAVYALGMVPNTPDAKQVMVDLGQGKYVIDNLIMLREKTEGNLTPEEAGQLNGTIAELQRAYVVRAQQAQEAVMKNAGIKPPGPGPV